MTPDQALEEVYRLTPQMKVYDQFISDVRWLPYTMFFHPASYRSEVVNTDSLGFRDSPWNGQSLSVGELPSTGPINLLVGGSNVVGTGATRDAFTTSACLSEITGEAWLNFGSRGYNALQEALLFLMHRHRFDRLNRVVILSGMNTLTLEGLPDSLSSDHGRFYYSYEYNQYMSKYSQDLRRRSGGASLATKKGVLGRLTNILEEYAEDADPTSTIIDDRDSPPEERLQRASGEIVKSVALWKELLAPLGVSPVFVLQPLTYWSKDYMTPFEEDIFNAIDSCPNNFWRLFGKILGKEVHRPFSALIEKGCREIDVDYFDMNDLLKGSPLARHDLFVDRVHCTDEGYAEIARLIKSEIIL
ncbi:hypothetical protein BCh11DRAFT_03912 [Burkholderia sp. Ch1-1]|nr:hypothetical protein BCh11DRAFT_03912 [Burkholderia sp. Ch1-1]